MERLQQSVKGLRQLQPQQHPQLQQQIHQQQISPQG